MKRKVGRWTAIQSKLPETPEGEALWQWIEHRTWGKYGYSEVAIGLTKAQEAIALEAERQLKPDEQHRA